MRWRAILAPLRHSHSASSRASFSTLPRRRTPQKGPSRTPLPSQEEPRSSSIANSGKNPSAHVTEVGNASSRQAKTLPIRSSTKTIAISEDKESSFESGAGQGASSPTCRPSAVAEKARPSTSEVGNASSRQAKTLPIRSSTKTIATSKDKESSFESGAGQGASSPTFRRSRAAEKARPSTSEAVKPEAGRRETFFLANTKPDEVSHLQVSKPSRAQLAVAEGHDYKASASSSNHATQCSVINALKNSTSAVNQRNGEASLSEVKAVVKIDELASARTTKTSPSQTEHKATPRALSYGSLSKNAMRSSITQEGERLVRGALNKRLGSDSSLAEEDVFVGAMGVPEGVGLSEDVTISSNNDTSECMLANGSSEHPEGSVAVEDKNKAGSRKSFVVSFPVTVFTEWWSSCFLQGNRPYYTSLNHPLNKVYVWLAAYQRAHFDATGQYADGPSSALLMIQLLGLLNAVLDGRFRWGDKKLVYLPAPVGHIGEPLSNVTTFPSFQDRVVHEILHLVLEPIFEARFSARSHGFRPGRNEHTALRAAQRSFQGCTWFISGNLSLLHEEKYATHLVDSAFRFVRDTRVTFLLKSGLLGGMSEKEGSPCECIFPDCSKLRNLLCNAFLDHLDWFMDEKISSLLKKEQPCTRSSSNLLFKPERARIERPRKLEYLRYGTEILVACNGTREEAEPVRESVISFFKQKFSVDFGNILTISHISDGVKFLDHVISQKIVHPIISCRRASSGRVFEKRAHRIRLCINASKECCLMYLKKIKTPTSLNHIEEMLSVLDNWYHYAENKEKVMQYCKLTLCYLYAKGVIEKEEEGLMDFAEKFKETICMVVYDQTKSGGSAEANLMPDFFWIPEHENVLRDHAWLQSKSSMAEVAASLKNRRKASPQQHMSQVLWQYLGGFYGSYTDNSWEPEVKMQTCSQGQEFTVDTKLEDFAESVG